MCDVFGNFLYCFAAFDSRDFKFSASSDGKGPGCVAQFCAMEAFSSYLDKPYSLLYSTCFGLVLGVVPNRAIIIA